jgi:rod shape-determining protein MreD
MRRPVAAAIAKSATPGRSLWIPAVSIMAGSCMTILPHVFSAPLLPPFGLLMLLGWRLLRPELFRIWAPVPLGLFDDLLSGQPLGSAMLLWTLCFLVLDMVDRRMLWRDFRQDWFIGIALIAAVIAGGALIAWPGSTSPPVIALGIQLGVSAALFPLVTRIVARLDSWRA